MNEENKPSTLAAAPDLEAIAKAIASTYYDWDDISPTEKDGYRQQAARVIAALPSPAAPLEALDLEAEEKAFHNWRRTTLYESSPTLAALKAWKARAALSPSSTAPSGSGRKCWVMWSTLENRPVGICTEPESKYTRFPALNMEAVPMVEAPGEKGKEEG